MRLLLDSCMSGKIKDELTTAGHDVVWTGDWVEDPGDDEILAYGLREGRILITLDKDFGEMAVVYRLQHAGIIRLSGSSVKKHTLICLQVLQLYGDELQAGAIVTAEPNRVRIRPSTTDNY